MNNRIHPVIQYAINADPEGMLAIARLWPEMSPPERELVLAVARTETMKKVLDTLSRSVANLTGDIKDIKSRLNAPEARP